MSDLKKIFGDNIELQIQEAIENGGHHIVTIADPIGKYLGGDDLDKKDKLTRSQIRNIYTMAKKMQMKGVDFERFILLKPKIAYITKKRGANQGLKLFGEILLIAIDATYTGHEEKHFNNFMDFFESILAYHVRYGGN